MPVLLATDFCGSAPAQPTRAQRCSPLSLARSCTDSTSSRDALRPPYYRDASGEPFSCVTLEDPSRVQAREATADGARRAVVGLLPGQRRDRVPASRKALILTSSPRRSRPTASRSSMFPASLAALKTGMRRACSGITTTTLPRERWSSPRHCASSSARGTARGSLRGGQAARPVSARRGRSP